MSFLYIGLIGFIGLLFFGSEGFVIGALVGMIWTTQSNRKRILELEDELYEFKYNRS
ncbi:hypothetical protein GLW08_04390 [Pontibacillus yanchengensis]|uniref:Uncharacterized protein n=2 Tax=Pontibacillus yanchengensis TaxID=462910 RepID=A0ACC7VCQ5_9BACI|nr:hypothetical protein [Pontibacillus yanchengensis]MYL31995.1 hypothetical protein [Pontibacillus yanchengensis]MYL52572.1 hypothetical protein [Pontibacillus yanchengensis]